MAVENLFWSLEKASFESGLLSLKQMQLPDLAKKQRWGMHQIPTEESNIEMNDSF